MGLKKEFYSIIFGTFILRLNSCEKEMEVEREKVERFCERVSVWMCVCQCAGSLSDSHEMPRASN